MFGEVRCHAIMIHIDQVIHLYLFFLINFIEPVKKTHYFPHRWCWWHQEFKYVWSGFLCCV